MSFLNTHWSTLMWNTNVSKIGFVAVFIFCGITGCKQEPVWEVKEDLKKYYDQFNIVGSFAFYDPQANKYILYNKEQFDRSYTPASTFKICNALIGIETGVIKDASFIIPWDSVVRNPVWDKDHDLRTAFENSTVWYFQELARNVGATRMKQWIDSAHYGNTDTSGGIDQFWLSGGLRISPKQQLEFLQRLHDNTLPFSPRSMDIVKDIMIVKDSAQYTLRAKSGWGGYENNELGWYVGYLEHQGKVYYFANCIQVESKQLEDVNRAIAFDQARPIIVEQILKELGCYSK